MDSGILRNRSTLLAAASILAVGTGSMPTLAQAQAAAEAGQQTGVEDDNVIVVTGFRASLEDALNAKRESNLIIESVTAEDIGKFPDQNVAESLQRLPGIPIDRENGQGSKVRIRGLDQNVTRSLQGRRRQLQPQRQPRGRAFRTDRRHRSVQIAQCLAA